MTKKNFASRLRMGLATGLTVLIGALNVASAKSPSFYAESAIVSDFVAPHGMFLEGRESSQNILGIDFNNGFSGFVWQNYDIQSQKTNELDSGIQYAHKISDGLSASVGYQYWNYLNGEFGEHNDNVLKAGAKYSNKYFDLKWDFTYLFGHDQTPTGNRNCFGASKTFDLGKVANTNISLTPSIRTSFIEDYYGHNGFPSQITYGLNLGLSRGNWNANLFVNKQDGKTFDDKTWGGASIGYSFGGK